MIKITFEISEDFITENVKAANVLEKMKNSEGGNKSLAALFDMMCFGMLKKEVDKGTTEFVVTKDKLDDKSKELYDKIISEICGLAAFSEYDMKKEKDEEPTNAHIADASAAE